MDEELSIIDTKTRNEKIQNFLVQNKKLIILSITVVIIVISSISSPEISGYVKEFLSSNVNKLILIGAVIYLAFNNFVLGIVLTHNNIPYAQIKQTSKLSNNCGYC